MKLRAEKYHLFVISFICALSFAAAAGCGGGGGGSAPPPVQPPAGDTTSPVLVIISPNSGALVSDVDFVSAPFYIQLRYTDASPMNISSLSVQFKMDNGPSQEIKQYFAPGDTAIIPTLITSSGLSVFTHGLLELPSNDISRTMTVSASIRDTAGNIGTTSSSFTVYPVAPPSQ